MHDPLFFWKLSLLLIFLGLHYPIRTVNSSQSAQHLPSLTLRVPCPRNPSIPGKPEPQHKPVFSCSRVSQFGFPQEQTLRQ